MTISAVTFDLWDTVFDDESDEPKRKAQGLESKPETRHRLLLEALERHHEITRAEVDLAYAVANAAFYKVWQEASITWSNRERLEVLLKGLGKPLPDDELAALSSRTEVIGRAAPLLVSLAEEGWLEGEVPQLVVRRYVEPFFGPGRGMGLPRDAQVGCVVLGCTHFPLFHGLIERELEHLGGRGIPVVDSAQQTAREVRDFLVSRQLGTPDDRGGSLQVLVTDMPKSFEEVATRFLGDAVGQVEQVDLKP